MTTPTVGATSFNQTDSLANFERSVMTHLENTGCDGVANQTTSYDKINFVNIINQHAKVTLPMVMNYWNDQMVANLIDAYEMANLRAFKIWLLALIHLDLKAIVEAKLSPGGTRPEAWMILIGEICSESHCYFEKLKTQLTQLKLSDFRVTMSAI